MKAPNMTIQLRKGPRAMPWAVQWRDTARRKHTRFFLTRAQAQRFKDDVAAILRDVVRP